MNLYLLKFNNYYNRIVKKFNTLVEYLVTPYYNNDVVENVNFNPNDGVDTKQIINSNGKFDYCILSDGITIESRWFILESKRQRNGQYLLTLRRDLVVDNYNSIINAPTFIEKATVSNSDPAIFNNEEMGFNQIKTSETLLKDKTQARWMVGFLARNTTMEAESTVTLYPPTTYDSLGAFNELYNSLKDSEGLVWDKDNTNYTYIVKVNESEYAGTGAIDYLLKFNTLGGKSSFGLSSMDATLRCKGYDNVSNALNYYANNISQLNAVAPTYFGINSITELLQYNGKTLLGDNNTYWKINLKVVNTTKTKSVTAGTLYDTFNTITNANPYVTGRASNDSYSVVLEGQTLSLELEQQYGETIKYKIEGNQQLIDAPYAMFAIPYDAVTINVNNQDHIITTAQAQETALALSQDLITKFGGTSGNLYDIQLLGYCPLQDYISTDGKIILTSGASYTAIRDKNNNPVTYMLWAEKSKFHFTIPYSINITDYKLSNECDLYRLSSGDYSSSFQFSAAKNGGVSFFDFDCYYKPYSSYIHCNPNFNRLYGYDDNSSRGLVVTGDSSLTQISNAYETYKRQNINFENIFKRQIENMEFNNRMSNIQAGVGAIASTLTAGVTAGAVFGPLGGAVAGLMSAAGGAADYATNIALQNEALDYKKDMFGYELGNIKAMPNTLTRVSTLSENNKIWVVLEYYTCTDEEKQALKDKIKYNGMTVMRIGKIVDFLQEDYSYIKGKVIRLEDIADDTNYLNQIANEIFKGVFIK